MTCDLWLFLPGPGLGCSKMGFRFGVFVTAGGTNQSERTRVISSSVCEQVFLPYLIPLWFWFFSRLIIPSLISFLLCSAPPLPHDPHFLLFVRLFSFFFLKAPLCFYAVPFSSAWPLLLSCSGSRWASCVDLSLLTYICEENTAALQLREN